MSANFKIKTSAKVKALLVLILGAILTIILLIGYFNCKRDDDKYIEVILKDNEEAKKNFTQFYTVLQHNIEQKMFYIIKESEDLQIKKVHNESKEQILKNKNSEKAKAKLEVGKEYVKSTIEFSHKMKNLEDIYDNIKKLPFSSLGDSMAHAIYPICNKIIEYFKKYLVNSQHILCCLNDNNLEFYVFKDETFVYSFIYSIPKNYNYPANGEILTHMIYRLYNTN